MADRPTNHRVMRGSGSCSIASMIYDWDDANVFWRVEDMVAGPAGMISVVMSVPPRGEDRHRVSLTPGQARKLGAALVEAADAVDKEIKCAG